MIVIDVGCASQPRQGGIGGIESSVMPLLLRFRPEALYGFDPAPSMSSGNATLGGTDVRLKRIAAWTYDGLIEYADAGIEATVIREQNGNDQWDNRVLPVECFDLAAWIERHDVGPPIVLKLDCEGAEYTLLEHLIEREVDKRLKLLLVEWHDVPGSEVSRAWIDAAIRCPVEEW